MEINENENRTTQNLWNSEKSEIYSNIILPQETRDTSNKQPKFTPKTTGKKNQRNHKVSGRKEIIKIRTEIKPKEGEDRKE